jgi:hypothetical protein
MSAHRSLPGLAAALRRAGVAVPTGSLVVAARALAAVEATRREDVRDALRAALVSDPDDFALFGRLFDALFPAHVPVPTGSRLELPPGGPPPSGSRRLAEALPPVRAAAGRPPEDAPELDASGTASDRERLASRDFEQMTAAELAEARRLIAQSLPPPLLRPTRRHAPDPAGRDLDLRRMLRASRGHVDALRPLRRARRQRPRHWFVLIDVSGSMATYARMFLHFAHALGRRVPGLEAFAFATRLTRLTRALRHSDPDAAVQEASGLIADWDSGTRIGECLAEFNLRFARRTLARGGSVLLFTDGLETGDCADLETEVARLARTCREIVWVNPLLRSASWAPLAAGAAVLARHTKRRAASHDLRSLEALGRALAGEARERQADQSWRDAQSASRVSGTGSSRSTPVMSTRNGANGESSYHS